MKSELDQYLRSYDSDRGWAFAVGPAELFYFRDRLIVPGGSVLDIGSGYGRASMQFALEGMNVHAIDTNEQLLKRYRKAVGDINRKRTGCPPMGVHLTTEVGDAGLTDLGNEKYDVVILSEFPIHYPNKAGALDIIARAARSVKPGGHIFVSVLSKLDSAYEEFRASCYPEREARIIDDDVVEILCNCSGELRREPVLFFEPGDVLLTIQNEGCVPVYSRNAPCEDGNGSNVMFGEDDYHCRTYSTVLAQKQITT